MKKLNFSSWLNSLSKYLSIQGDYSEPRLACLANYDNTSLNGQEGRVIDVSIW